MEPEGLTEAQVRLLAGLELARQEGADGWVVVTTDDANGALVNAAGPFEQAEQALVIAGQMDEESKSLQDDDDPGWTHTVIPLFKAG